MEKYTNYRDRGTGISPFMPVHASKHGTIFKTVKWTIFTVKMVILLPLIVFTIGGTFTGPMIYLLMKLVFNYSVEVTVQGKRRRAVNKKIDYPHRGNLYICNYTSVLDALVCRIIAQDTSVLFLVACENEIYGMRMWSFIKYTLNQLDDISKYSERIDTWKDICEDYTCFLFPEGVTSNGKSVLPFELDDLRLKQFILGDDFTSSVGKRKNSSKTKKKTSTTIREKISQGNEKTSGGEDVREVIQWCQIKHVPSSLTTTIPETGLGFFKRLLYVNKPQSRCKIIPPTTTTVEHKSDDITAHGRVTLNGGQTPVARTLNAAQKARFVAEWGARVH